MRSRTNAPVDQHLLARIGASLKLGTRTELSLVLSTKAGEVTNGRFALPCEIFRNLRVNTFSSEQLHTDGA